MIASRNQSTEQDATPLGLFELPSAFVRPAVAACRLFNTAVDSIFYNVSTLRSDLSERDAAMREEGEKRPSRIIDFDALADPEGSLLLIDAQTAPYVHQFHDVGAFLNSPHPETRDVAIATITGVGSSALGSAALAWDISKALKQPILAIVPSYGVADMVLQGIGGWFGFGLHDFLAAKSGTQNAIANVAPGTATIGRKLSGSVPDAQTLHGAPVFRYGSGSSDVLHAEGPGSRNPRKRAPRGRAKATPTGARADEGPGEPVQDPRRSQQGRAPDRQCAALARLRQDAWGACGDTRLSDRRRCARGYLSPISRPLRCARSAEYVGPFARTVDADLAQHQPLPATCNEGRRAYAQVALMARAPGCFHLLVAEGLSWTPGEPLKGRRFRWAALG